MLSLRAYKAEDASQIAQWLRDEQVFIWWSAGNMGTYPLVSEKLNAYYAPGVAAGDWFPRVMEEDGKAVGSMLMRWKDREAGILHFGFIVVNPDARGKGLGYAMLAMALEYAFYLKGAKRVTLHVFADNAAAIRCYERLGFTRTGEFTAEIDGKKARLYAYEKKPLNA